MEEEKSQSEEKLKPASKNIYIATSAMTVGVKENNGKYFAEPKSGGVAPGILNSLPAEYKLKGWRGIVKSKGKEVDTKSEEALKEFGVKQGFDSKDSETQTFQNEYVDENVFFEFYVNATNGTVWPLIHDMPEKRGRTTDFEALKSVDQAYSEKLFAKIVQDLKEENQGKPESDQKTLDDVTIWAHDYHVFNVPGMIKDLARESDLKGTPNVSFFHHEPWPAISPEASPDGKKEVKDGVVYADFNDTEKAEFKAILENLVQADTLGFHTEGDAKGFLATVEHFGITSQDLEKRVFVDPIGSPKSNIRQNADIRMPFLQEGFASDSTLNQQLGTPQANSEGTTSSAQMAVDRDAMEFRDKTFQEVADFRKLVTALGQKKDLTPQEQQLVKQGPGIINRMMNGGATPYDKMTVSEQVYFDPKKTHINSVQRFDYTKGIEEFLLGYQQFLRDLKAQGKKTGDEPWKNFQFNLITGAGRSGDQVHEYTQYEKKAKKLMAEIKEEFPGALYHFKAGIPNPELPIANAASDILLVSSVADGYVIAGPEILESQIAYAERQLEEQDKKAERGEETTPLYYNPQLIISDNVGLARDLDQLGENAPNRLQMVQPTPEEFTRALHQAHQNLQETDVPLKTALTELQTISDVIPAAEGDFGKIATTVMEGEPTEARATAKTMTDMFRDMRQGVYFEDREEAAPVVQETAPVVQETAPVAQETAPVAQETAPIPVPQEAAPVAQEPVQAASPFAALAASPIHQGGTEERPHTMRPPGKKSAKQAKRRPWRP
ncbi:MAG: trehalose-6-phosphate synthase [Bacteroidota bacterium]